MSRTKFELVQQENGEWFPRIRAGNGEKWWSSESSKRKSDAKKRLARFMSVFNVVAGLNEIVEVPRESFSAAKQTKG